MRKLFIALILCLSFLPSVSFAEQSSAKALVERGLIVYIKDGSSVAMKAWLAGSGMEGDVKSLSESNSLRHIEDYFGKPESYDILKENIISPRSQMIIFSINFTKGVAFGRFQAYRTQSGEWVATEFRFHTEASAILPSEMVFGK